MFTFSTKCEIRHFHVVVVHWAEKCAKKRDSRAELLFCQSKPIAFLPFLLTSPLLLYYRFGRKRGVVIPMLLAAVGAAGSVLLTTDDESNKGTVSIYIEPWTPSHKLPYPVNPASRILSI